ncbi:unnamed protein product, partial [Medioppia subpectinata]
MWTFTIGSVPGPTALVLERQFDEHNVNWRFTGNKLDMINLGSYNYLGYSVNEGHITDSVQQTIKELGVGVGSTPNEVGRQEIHHKLESLVAQYLGVEDSIVYGMGFATNAFSIPALLGKGCLVISDEQNHASLILGCRLSGAVTKVFKHNNMEDLERIVKNGIIEGQPKTHREWRKI